MSLTSTNLADLVAALDWYHTLDLGNGIVTPGHYDHRPHLDKYRLPTDLTGKTALDIGAASGFFAFELERRGAQVTATDLPDWFDHDFGPVYQPDQTRETGNRYLHQPIEVARDALGSRVKIQYINIYDIAPETVGMFDLVFCGSVLIHLTDPTKALWNIACVTRERAILATVITPHDADAPHAEFIGHHRGDAWWIPTRACLELMAASAGFAGIEWVGEFQLNYRARPGGAYHGVMHCYKTTAHWTPQTQSCDQVIARYANRMDDFTQLQNEIAQLRARLAEYEQRRAVRLANWLAQQRRRFVH